jgi:hypothetical protein
MAVHNQNASRHYKPSDIAPDFIQEIEDELHRRLGKRVTLALGDGIVAVRAEDGLPSRNPVVVMDSSLLLSRTRPEEWADLLEERLKDGHPGRLSARVEDVELLFAEILKSPSPEMTGAIVLDHAGEYDDEFFEALGEVMARDKAGRRFDRARKLEKLDEYLREVRRRVDKGETAQMRTELARGAAQEAPADR